MGGFRSGRALAGAVAATLALLFCASSVSAADQFEGLMVDGGNVRRFNTTTGAVLETRAITGQQALFGMLAMDAAEQYLYLIDGFNDTQSDRTFRLDWRTGAGSVVGNTGFNWNFRWLDFHPQTGVLYAGQDNELYTINPATGAATFVRNITAAPGTTDLGQITAFAIRADGQAFIADLDNWGRNDFQLYSLDLSTGQAARVGTMFTGTSSAWAAEDLTFGPDGNLYATRRVFPSPNNELYRIDPATGAPTFLYNVGTGSIGGPGVAFVTVIPEPTSFVAALLAAGGIVLGPRARRRRS